MVQIQLLLSAAVELSSLLPCSAPSSSPTSLNRFVPADHKSDPVEVSWLPLVTVGAKFHALLTVGTVHQQGLPVFAEFHCPLPEEVADPCCRVSHESAGRDLQQPFRKISPQTSGAGGDYENDHGAAVSSAQLTPDAITSSSLHSISSASE